jgi:hypothetical protein
VSLQRVGAVGSFTDANDRYTNVGEYRGSWLDWQKQGGLPRNLMVWVSRSNLSPRRNLRSARAIVGRRIWGRREGLSTRRVRGIRGCCDGEDRGVDSFWVGGVYIEYEAD